jgi:hypothetical protein
MLQPQGQTAERDASPDQQPASSNTALLIQVGTVLPHMQVHQQEANPTARHHHTTLLSYT